MRPNKLPLAIMTAVIICTAPLLASANTNDLHAAQKAVRLQQFEHAFSLYSALANAGNAEAQNQLANMLLRGLGTEKSEAAAILWLKKAASQSHPSAQFTLSQWLRDDPKQANALLTASAQQDYRAAQTQLNRSSAQMTTHELSTFEVQWFAAARKNQATTLQTLLTDEHQLTTEDSAGRTAIFYAAEFNSTDALNWLIGQGIDVNHRDNNGLTAAQTALERNNQGAFSVLLASSDLNQTFSNGDNLLHYAIRLHHYKYIGSLIKAGANINHRNNDGWTPIDLADFQGAQQAVSLLKSQGAQNGRGWQFNKSMQDVVDVAQQLEEDSRLPPAAMAIINNNEKLLAQILRQKPDLVNQPLENDSTLLILATKQNKPKMLATLLTFGADVNQAAYNSTRALQVAVRLNNTRMVEALLAAGASPTQVDKNNNDALSTAIKENQQDIANLLIDNLLSDDGVEGARSRMKINAIPINHYILLATQYQFDSITERLIHYATPKAEVDIQKRNALWFAAKYCKTELTEQLLNIGVSATQEDTLGRTPLMIAVEQSCLPTAKKLKPFSDLNHKTNNGNTPLILAALVKDTQTSAWLIKNKADVDARNQRGDTALIVAVKGNALKVAKQLVMAKANPERKNRLGFTATDLAPEASPEMVMLLEPDSRFKVF